MFGVGADDPYNLDRFVQAQETTYDQALAEIRSGRKRTHWMWWVFPQLKGLGTSWNSVHFSLAGADEAAAYLAHPVLGPRLVTCAEAVLHHHAVTATAIFGQPDDMKLRSSATLFATVSPAGSAFHRIIEDFFHGKPDETTLGLLRPQRRK